MLTAEQCEIVASITESGGILCPDCAAENEGKDWKHMEKAKPIIEYEATSSFPDGLWCDVCGAEIVEPFTCDCETPELGNGYDKEHCGHCGGLLSEEQIDKLEEEET